jgi:hypothetical protein
MRAGPTRPGIVANQCSIAGSSHDGERQQSIRFARSQSRSGGGRFPGRTEPSQRSGNLLYLSENLLRFGWLSHHCTDTRQRYSTVESFWEGACFLSFFDSLIEHPLRGVRHRQKIMRNDERWIQLPRLVQFRDSSRHSHVRRSKPPRDGSS